MKAGPALALASVRMVPVLLVLPSFVACNSGFRSSLYMHDTPCISLTQFRDGAVAASFLDGTNYFYSSVVGLINHKYPQMQDDESLVLQEGS